MSFLEKIYQQSPWLLDLEKINEDVHLKKLKKYKFIWRNKDFLEYQFENGVYIVTGPRQIGKSTHLKMLIQEKINTNNTNCFLYFNCDFLENKKDIVNLVEEYLYNFSSNNKNRIYIILDEITSISDGILAIKYLIDNGKQENISYILSGSSTVNIKKTGEYLPGRRGKGFDFIFNPLSFKDLLEMKYDKLNLSSTQNLLKQFLEIKEKINLKKELEIYMTCGGIPRVINEYEINKQIDEEIYNTYKDWIVSEIAKHGRKEYFAKSILLRIIKSIGSDLSYNSFIQDLSIGSHNTIHDYLDFLEQSFIVNIIYNFDFHQQKINYKKNKKIYLNDPFIYWTIDKWLNAKPLQQFENLKNDIVKSQIIENICFNHLKNLFQENLYFYKNKFEIDFINSDLSFEIKYRNNIAVNDFKNIFNFEGKKYIISKDKFEINKNYNIIPVELFLLMSEY